MRTITAAQKQALEDLAAEGLLGGLPVQTAEKDIHITELLKKLSELQVHHDHFSDIDPGRGEHVRHDVGIRLDFPLIEYPDGGDNPRIRDAHRHYVVGAGYQTAYSEFPSLRPELKLELIQRQPLLPLERREFGYLYESLAGLPATSMVVIDCISVAETAAEKVLSLLRRCAYKWDGHQTKGDMDPPTFEESFASFEAVALDFLAAC